MHAESKRQRLLHILGERKGIFIIAFQMALFALILGTGFVFAEEEEEEKTISATAYTYKISPQDTRGQIPHATFENVSLQPTQTPAPTPPTENKDKAGEEREDGAVWERLADCESGGNWEIDTGNGYYGGLQFSQSAWESVGGSGSAADASKEEQIKRGKMLQQMRGWTAWGLCAKELGLN